MWNLIKLSDDVFKGKHPNGINEGYTKQSEQKPDVIIGKHLNINSFYTSEITEITFEDEQRIIFKTKNSTYQLDKIEEK